MRSNHAAPWLVLVLVVLVTASLWRACSSEPDAKVAQRARTEQAATQRAATAEAALAREHQAQALSDSLAARLAQAEKDLATTAKERDEALTKATTGRVCFGSAALRVLNGAPGIRVAAVPAPAPGAAAAHGPAAADTGGQPGLSAGIGTDDGAGSVATDTGVSRWVAAAGAQYETCRARLDALIDYELGVPPGQPVTAP